MSNDTVDGKYVRLRLVRPPGWTVLPLDPAIDAEAWARADVAAAAAGLEALPSSIGAEAAAGMLAAAARDAQGSHPEGIAHHALAFQPDPIGPVLVLAHCLVLPFDDEPLDAHGLLDRLGVDGETLGEPQRSQVTLQVGPAVRVRRMTSTDPEGPAEGGDGSASVIEGITYVAMPPGLRGYVYVNSIWTALTMGDQLAEIVDELAARLTLDFRQ